jgi:hypothetical protein
VDDELVVVEGSVVDDEVVEDDEVVDDELVDDGVVVLVVVDDGVCPGISCGGDEEAFRTLAAAAVTPPTTRMVATAVATSLRADAPMRGGPFRARWLVQPSSTTLGGPAVLQRVASFRRRAPRATAR